MPKNLFGNQPETIIYASASRQSRKVNYVLMGSILERVSIQGDWFEVDALGKGKSGWVHKDDVRDTPVLKVFFVDVGQGDGAIVESPEGIMMVDAGPNANFFKFVKYRYRRLLRNGSTLHIKSLVVSHPDYDHYNGFTALLQDKRFTFGTIFHNGIIRYDSKSLPPRTDFDLGKLKYRNLAGSDREVLTESFSTLEKAQTLVDEGHLAPAFRNFWQAALEAKAQGRLGSSKRITARDAELSGYTRQGDENLSVKILGPVVTQPSGKVEYVAFPDAHNIAKPNPTPSSSHTRNGHSIVLKLEFGAHSILLGGDLNIPAQQHLMSHYGEDNPFRVDVAKACHHGSSDFHVDFLKKTLPQVNVFSSGDNKSFDHPMADAVGAIGRHTRGSHPLLFSTELARAVSSKGTHFGLINLRSNGAQLVMAQMKEQRGGKADIWDSFTVPWPGKFAQEIRDSES